MACAAYNVPLIRDEVSVSTSRSGSRKILVSVSSQSRNKRSRLHFTSLPSIININNFDDVSRPEINK